MCIEKIIFVKNIEDVFLSNPRRLSKFSFYCQNCGSYTEKFFYRLNTKQFLLCTKCLRKYTNSLRSKEAKEISLKKHEESCLKHFGTKYPIQNKQIKEKRKQTCIQKYGESTFLTTKQGKEKTKNTNLIKFKTFSSNQSDIVKKKKKQVFVEKYNVDNPLKSKEIREKIKQTCLNKYGVENYSQSEGIKKHRRNQYFFDNQYFDSKLELCFYIYCKDQNLSIQRCTKKFEYIVNNQIHYYFPDFEIDGKFFEIKGNQFLDKKTNTWINPFNRNLDILYEAKHQCALKNNVIILYSKDCQKYLDYVNQKYSSSFLKNLKKISSNNSKNTNYNQNIKVKD